jgi:signal transduction histidine kinase
VRRLGVIYVLVTVPLLAASSAFVSGERAYVYFFVFTGAVYTTPALGAWWAIHRQPRTTKMERDVIAYRLWLVGTLLVCGTGVASVVRVTSGSDRVDFVGWPLVVAATVLLNTGSVRLTRIRSGQRALSVDMIEAAMAVIVVAAPCVLLWGDGIAAADESWFTIPAGLATIGMIFGAYWALALVVRMGPNAGPLEYGGLALTVVGMANATAQVAQGIADFSLPSPPLIALHAACLSFTLLVPLHLCRSVRPGLERLAPQAQVRVGYLATLMTLVGLPVLYVITLAVEHRSPWAPQFSLAATTLVVVLAGLRHLASMRETRQLYTQVEQSSARRQRLLADVMQHADDDRHRAAAQLHEQAVTAYTSVVSLLAHAPGSGPGPSPFVGATHRVRDSLAEYADSLRELMRAIEPLPADRRGTRNLAVPIHGYLDNVYGDRPSPQLTVTTADEIFLDWPTETILLRIVQEAIRNVRRDGDATRLDIVVDVDDDIVTLRISDDGAVFDPEASPFATGIAAMRAYAAVVDGAVSVDTTLSQGTTITAQLGPPPSIPRPRRRLRVVQPDQR